MSSRDWSWVMNLRKLRYKLVKNIRPENTSACHLEGEKKVPEKLYWRKALFLNRAKEFTILLLSNNLPPTTVPVHEELTYKISRFTIRSIVYQWNNSCLFKNTRITPEIHKPPLMPTGNYLITQPPCWDLPHFYAHFWHRWSNFSLTAQGHTSGKWFKNRIWLLVPLNNPSMCDNRNLPKHKKRNARARDRKEKADFLKKGSAKCILRGFSKPTV